MTKNIIIGVLAVAVIVLLVGFLFQKERADKSEAIALLNFQMAKEASLRAEQSMKRAEEMRQMAAAEAHRALEELVRAKNQKK